ncbi:hypothetical protein [Mycobacterium sp.]|jgi:hypothetical protein|uniref:hypothetical protein n=1 Tax=Mycobacterium sp. TaxID=1785 RepID=UPI00389AA761
MPLRSAISRLLHLGPEQLRPKTVLPVLGSLGLGFHPHGGSNLPPRQRRGPSRNTPLEIWCSLRAMFVPVDVIFQAIHGDTSWSGNIASK